MILAIETSAEPASVALYKEGKIEQRTFPNKNQVNVPLADELASLLREERQVSEILVGVGPGSYSGARVGLATAEAIALVYSARVIALPSLCGIAGDSVLLGDARRGAFFINERPTGRVQRVGNSVTVYSQDEFSNAVEQLGDTELITFEPVEKLPLPSEIQSRVVQVYSTAEGLLTYWDELDEAEKLSSLPPEVLYVRPPNITKAKNPFA